MDALATTRQAFDIAGVPIYDVMDVCARHGLAHVDPVVQIVCMAVPAWTCQEFLCPVPARLLRKDVLVVVWACGPIRELARLLDWAEYRGYSRLAFQRWRRGVQCERFHSIPINALKKKI